MNMLGSGEGWSWSDYECEAVTTTKDKYLQILILPILDFSQDDMRKLLHKYTISAHYSLKKHNYKVQGREQVFMQSSIHFFK